MISKNLVLNLVSDVSLHPYNSDERSRRLGRALRALHLEQSQGHVDVRGARSLFSEYAASELVRLGDALPATAGDRWSGAIAGGFARYRNLSPTQRASLVAEARALVLAAAENAARVEQHYRSVPSAERALMDT